MISNRFSVSKALARRRFGALALASELVHGTSASLRDPARFSFAHGGKDGTPFPVDKLTYDKTIEVLQKAINRSAIDRSEKVQAFKRLQTSCRRPACVWLEHRGNEAVGRCRHTEFVGDSNDGPTEPGQLEWLVTLQILEHRRLHLRWQLVKAGDHVVEHLRRQHNAFGSRDRHRFQPRRLTHGKQIGIVPYDADGKTRNGRHPAEGREPHELGPDINLDLITQLRLDARRPARLEQRFESRRPRAIELAECQPIVDGVADHSGLGNHCGNECRPPAVCSRPTTRVSARDALDAVLKGDDYGVGAD